MTTVMKAMRLLAFGAVGLAFSLSSCKGATSKDDLPLEEWVVTSAFVAWADSSHTAYGTEVTLTYADASSGTGRYTDDYAGHTGTDPMTLYAISSGSISGAGYGSFSLSTTPDPATLPVVTFDTNHYFYRVSDASSTFRTAVAKCHIKTPSIAVTFEQ